MLRQSGRRKRLRSLRHRASVRAYRWLSGKNVIRVRPGEHFNLNHHRIHLADLQRDLHRLRIVQLTDLHVGKILKPEHLEGIVDVANAAGGDIIAVTGDMLDSSNKYLRSTVEAFSKLDAPLGAYFVLGNHDYRDNIDQVIREFDRLGLPLLINQSVQIAHHNSSITIGGIDYAKQKRRMYRDVHRTAANMPDADLRILLAHHPHAFEAACRHKFHLTLSGHTHGGQLLVRKHKSHHRESFGLGNFAWRYPQGLYSRGKSHLFVSNGLGGSFPLRVRCPAEISVLDLHAA